MSDVIVAKIGGSTLGRHDTSLKDVVALQRQGLSPIVVHGGGAIISNWLAKHQLPTRFERGMRVTDARALQVVVAVLAGLVNKDLVATIQSLGGRAVGISGADGGLLQAQPIHESLGYAGKITKVDTQLLRDLLSNAFLPVVAPTALWWEKDLPKEQLLNVNADSAAGAISAAFPARNLIFLTDVPGIQDKEGRVMARLSEEDALALINSGVIAEGMIPKVEACLTAVHGGCESIVVDGREEHALVAAMKLDSGTVVGGENSE